MEACTLYDHGGEGGCAILRKEQLNDGNVGTIIQIRKAQQHPKWKEKNRGQCNIMVPFMRVAEMHAEGPFEADEMVVYLEGLGDKQP